MSLSEAVKKLGSIVHPDWLDNVNMQGDKVALYRKYADGDHRVIMSDTMKDMFFHGSKSERFNENYCQMIIDTFSDRLAVSGIEADNEDATQWGNELRTANRFDQLMIETHEATIRDGDAFVMLDFDNERDSVRWAHEPAYDGETGMVPVYDRMNRTLIAAVKLWKEAGKDAANFNIYYPDRIERYDGDGNERPNGNGNEAPWSDYGKIPIVHFKNRSRSTKAFGISSLADAIPLQDAINRNLVSMTFTGEMTAFQIYYMLGATPPSEFGPGSWVAVEGDISRDQLVEIGVLAAGSMTPFIEQGVFLEDRLGFITRTPLPQHMGSVASSGESLKEREKPLISKVKRFQVYGGNSWEDLMNLSHAMQSAFGKMQPPAVKTWSTQWIDPEIRNDTAIIENAIKVKDVVGDREFLRQIGKVYDYDEAKIDTLIEERANQTALALSQLNLPGFDNL